MTLFCFWGRSQVSNRRASVRALWAAGLLRPGTSWQTHEVARSRDVGNAGGHEREQGQDVGRPYRSALISYTSAWFFLFGCYSNNSLKFLFYFFLFCRPEEAPVFSDGSKHPEPNPCWNLQGSSHESSLLSLVRSGSD
jgi:hypothetical protein